jgi:hypothetical protein
VVAVDLVGGDAAGPLQGRRHRRVARLALQVEEPVPLVGP